MDPNERMVTRIKAIYYYLKKRGNDVHSTELAEEFGYTARTIQRDLKTLEYNNLVKNTGRGRWVVT